MPVQTLRVARAFWMFLRNNISVPQGKPRPRPNSRTPIYIRRGEARGNRTTELGWGGIREKFVYFYGCCRGQTSRDMTTPKGNWTMIMTAHPRGHGPPATKGAHCQPVAAPLVCLCCLTLSLSPSCGVCWRGCVLVCCSSLSLARSLLHGVGTRLQVGKEPRDGRFNFAYVTGDFLLRFLYCNV